jgi:hypothetical protein
LPKQRVKEAPQEAGRICSAGRGRRGQAPLRADTDGIGKRVRQECAEQGIPEKVEDPVLIANVVTLAFEGLAIPSSRP